MPTNTADNTGIMKSLNDGLMHKHMRERRPNCKWQEMKEKFQLKRK